MDEKKRQLELTFTGYVNDTIKSLIEYDPKVVRWYLKMEEVKKSTGQLYLIF